MNYRTLLLVLLATFSVQAFSQAPQLVNYQTVVRDASGKPLPGNTTVGVKFVIHNNTEQGTEVFSQTTSAQTNQFGLIALKIGSNANLAVVDWSNGNKYLQVLVDVTGGTNYVDMGTTQLISVPYALFAANSQQGPPGATGPSGPVGPAGPTGSGGGATGPSWDISSQVFNANGTLTFKTTKPDSVTTAKAAWITTGNSGTTPANNFVGTTDNQPLVIKTNGIGANNERMRFTATPQIVVNGTVPFGDVVLTVYGSNATNALNSVYGQTGTPIAAFSADTNIAIYGNNTGLGSGIYGLNSGTGTGVFGINTGPRVEGSAGVWGESLNGWGVFGVTSNSDHPGLPGVLGYGNSLYGTGVAGISNGLNIYYTYGDGSGGSFSGRMLGVYGRAYAGDILFSAGGYFDDSVDNNNHTYTAVAAYIAGTKFKMYGDGNMSTVVADNNNGHVIMFGPEAPEVLFQDYGEGVLVNGHAKIELDPVFSKNILVDDKHPLRVIIQPKGECEGLYVTNDNQTGFEVREMKGGQSNIRFTYQVVGNRADEVKNGVVVSKNADLRFPKAANIPSPTAHTIPGKIAPHK